MKPHICIVCWPLANLEEKLVPRYNASVGVRKPDVIFEAGNGRMKTLMKCLWDNMLDVMVKFGL